MEDQRSKGAEIGYDISQVCHQIPIILRESCAAGSTVILRQVVLANIPSFR